MHPKLLTFFQQNTQKTIASLFFIAFYGVILAYKFFFREPLYQDEIHFFDTTILFGKQVIPSLELLKTYPELNTPIPFIIGSWWTKLFGENIQALRWLTFLLSFLITNLFIWQSPSKSSKLWWCLFGVWLFPNYYLCTVYYYTDMFAMSAMMLGIVAYLYQRHAWAGFFFIVAVCCRQYMVAFPAAILAFEFIGLSLKQQTFLSGIMAVLQKKYWFWYVLACLSLLPWLVLWGGFAPAAEMARQHYDKISVYKFGFALYVSAVTAVYFVIPETIFSKNYKYYLDYPRKNTFLFLGLCIIVLVIIVFFPAQQTKNLYFDWPYLGYVDQGLMTIGIKGFVKQLVFGILMLISLMRFVRFDQSLASWVFIINTLLLGKAQLSWDKYSLPTVLVLWFLTLISEHHKFSTRIK